MGYIEKSTLALSARYTKHIPIAQYIDVQPERSNETEKLQQLNFTTLSTSSNGERLKKYLGVASPIRPFSGLL